MYLLDDWARLPQSIKKSEHNKWAQAKPEEVRQAWSEVVDYCRLKGKELPELKPSWVEGVPFPAI